MAIQVSPGVVFTEIDLSQYAARISTSIVGLVGGAEKGPINTPTYITNELQLVQTFGEPISTVSGDSDSAVSYMSHAALQYLRNGNQLWVVRVADEDGGTPAAAATVMLQATAVDILKVDALTKGEWANQASATCNEGIKVVTTDPSNSNVTNAKDISIYFMGALVEKYANVTFGTANEGVTNSEYNDLLTNAEDVINGTSTYVTVTNQISGSTVPDGTDASPDTSLMTTGKNGITGLVDADYVGTINVATGARSGLKVFEEVDTLDINLIAVPGETDAAAVRTALLSTAETRADCLAVIDPPFGLTPAKAVDFANGEGDYAADSSINSSYAALYWPWVKYYDGYNQENSWTPPSGWVLSQMAFNDRVADPWQAPAGLNRGRLSSALSIELTTSLGERELLYGNGNVVNPIVDFANDGITIWGQKTTQRIASALDRVNVRRMMLYAEKVIATSIRFLVFEPNDPITWRRFIGVVTPVLEGIKARRGITKFQVICDSSTNTETLINQNVMKGIILIQPTKTAEVLSIDFTLLATGAQFQEFTQN